MTQLKRLALPMLLSATVSLLAACATTMAISAIEISKLCGGQLWEPTYWKDAWPDDAVKQAKFNNRRRESVCGKPVK
jgi:hypothetical protein